MGCQKKDSKETVPKAADDVPQITHRKCAAYEVLQEQLAADPTLRTRMDEIEAYTQKVIKNPSAYKLVGDTIEIPVVVHVLYHTAAENINDTQVKSQITILNDDYQNKNADKNKLPKGSFQTVASTGLNVRFVLE